jgi:3-(3-hydroxy-phenyl)propionate hydroxylase
MTRREDLFDLVIVGLGPVGGAAANIAAQLGLRVVAIDSSPEVFGLPRAIHFDADVMRIFQSAGLAGPVVDLTRQARGSVHLGMDGKPIREFRVSGEPGDLGWSPHFMFYQPELDGLLRQSAARRAEVDVRLGWGCERVDVDREGVSVTVTATDGRRDVLRGKYVLACDGASSPIREQLGITLFDYEFEEPWIIVDLEVASEDLGPDHMIMYCDPQRPGTYVPGPGRHRRWEFMILPGEDGEQLRSDEAIRGLIEPKTPWLDVSEAKLLRSAVYKFHGLVATEWARGRVLLAGDAVHQTPPFYGQGMCHGVRDVRNVLWKLHAVLSGTADAAILDSYQTEREPHVRAIIESAVENGRYICTLDPALAAKRDAEYRERMRNGADVGSFRNVIPGLSAGLLDPGSRDRPEVGALFPQPRLESDDGVVMFDDLLGAGFALVLSGPEPQSEVADWFTGALGGRVVRDDTGALGAWFAAHGCHWALVRPDRYVFAAGRAVAESELAVGRLKGMLEGRLPLVAQRFGDAEAMEAEPVGP